MIKTNLVLIWIDLQLPNIKYQKYWLNMRNFFQSHTNLTDIFHVLLCLHIGQVKIKNCRWDIPNNRISRLAREGTINIML